MDGAGRIDMKGIVAFILSTQRAKRYTDSVALYGVPINYPRINPTTKHWELFNPSILGFVDSGISAEANNIELTATASFLQWRFVGDPDWIDLYDLSTLKGKDGKSAYELAIQAGFSETVEEWIASLHGKNGEAPQFQMENNTIQYRFTNFTPTDWTDLYTFSGGGDSGGGYTPPSGGIPRDHLAEDVQNSLGKADTALQEGDEFSGDYGDLTNVPAEFPPEAHTHELSDIADYSVLPIITHVQYAGEKMTMRSLSQSRQILRGTLSFRNEECSVRPIKLYFDKPIGENQYIQPFVYNRLGQVIKESSRGNNQELFRGDSPKQAHKKEKGWGQVNITQNIQRADSGAATAKPPLFTDSAGNRFFAHGIIKLMPGITGIVIPAEYQATELIYHTKSHSARTVRGAYLTANYSSTVIANFVFNNVTKIFTYTVTADGFISVGVDGSDSIFDMFLNNSIVNQDITISDDYARTTTPIKVRAGDVIKVQKAPYTRNDPGGVHGLFTPLMRMNSPDYAPLATHFRSHRGLADIRATKNEWVSHKAWMKFAVSEYVPPQGAIGNPQYVRGKYRKGTLSAITLASDRYVRPDANNRGGIVWTTSLIER